MNQQQKNYFIKRIDEIKSVKINEVEQTYSDPDLRVLRVQAFNDGTLSVKKRLEVRKIIEDMFSDKSQYIYNSNVPYNMGQVLISQLLDGVDDFTDEMETLTKGVEKNKRECKERITYEASMVKDVVMFGNESEALAKLAEFENTNYLK